MGCSPSKRRLFTGASEPISSRKALTQECNERHGESQSTEERQVGDLGFAGQVATVLESDQKKLPALMPAQESQPFLTEIDTAISESAPTREAEIVSLESRTRVDPLAQKQQEKAEGGQLGKDKGGKESEVMEKLSTLSKVNLVDAALKKACQVSSGVNGMTGSHVSKYEALQKLLDQATQTHLSLQPMAVLMAQRYEEINRELEEMAEEGERMLREQEDHLEWPQASSSEPPPEPLQYASKKIKLGAELAGDVGDSVLEEAVDYFSSFSALLEERLRAKRAAEQRLMQVLARVRVTSQCGKQGPEDGSLHSEDSGIGAESESLNGFDRHPRHRDSCDSSHQESNGTGHAESWTRTRRIGSLGKETSTWVEKGTEQLPQIAVPTQVERSPKILSMQCRSQSAESINSQAGDVTMRDYEGTSKDKAHQATKGSSASRYGEEEKQHLLHQVHSPHVPIQQRSTLPPRPFLRRHSSAELKIGENRNDGEVEDLTVSTGALGAIPPARPSPSAEPPVPVLHSSRNSVKRLINTFSSRENAVQSQDPSNAPVHFRGSRRYRVPMRSSTENTESDITNIKSGPDEQNGNSLPPPPPEVLMDKSFSHTGVEGGNHMLGQNYATSPHLRSSEHTVPLLPNHCTVYNNSSHHLVQKDNKADSLVRREGLQESEYDMKEEKTPSLLDHPNRIVQDYSDTPMKAAARTHILPPSPLQSHTLPNSAVSQQSAVPSEEGSSISCHLPPLPSNQKGLVNLTSSQLIARTAPADECKESPNETLKDSAESGIILVQAQTFSKAASQYGAVTWATSSSCTIPQHSPRSRLPLSAWSPQPFVRRGLSERRPGCSAPVRTSVTAASVVSHSTVTISTQGLEDRPIIEGELRDTHLNLRDTNDIVPEQCIMDQAAGLQIFKS